MKIKLWIVFLVVFSLTTTTGCAKKVRYSGFLTEHPPFRKGQYIDLIYFKRDVDFRPYRKVMMDHVVFYLKDDAKYKGIFSHDLEEVAKIFHKKVKKALGRMYPLVDKPGPDVLRIRVAITDIVLSKPALNTITAITPLLAASYIKKAITGTHAYVGQASMEFEVLDSQTNEQLAAGIDTKAAEKYKVIKGLSKWGHVEDAFEFWANRLRNFLDGVHRME